MTRAGDKPNGRGGASNGGDSGGGFAVLSATTAVEALALVVPHRDLVQPAASSRNGATKERGEVGAWNSQ